MILEIRRGLCLAALGTFPALWSQQQMTWTLDWQDEFVCPDGLKVCAPDPAKWVVRNAGQNRADNVVVEMKPGVGDGELVLMVRKKRAPDGGEWSTGNLTTAPSVVGRYGAKQDLKLFAPPKGGHARLEIRFRGCSGGLGCRVPGGEGPGPMVQGVQLGFWTFSPKRALPGTDIKCISGEIDILEHASPAGGKAMKNSIHIDERRPDCPWKVTPSEQFKSSAWENIPTGPGQKGFFDDRRWHTLRAEWGHDRVDIFMDGNLMNERTSLQCKNQSRCVEARYFAFDEWFPQALMLWTKLYGYGSDGSGGIGDAPIDWSRLPMEVRFDYVRFYVSPD